MQRMGFWITVLLGILLATYGLSNGQVVGNPFSFNIQNRTFGGISIPQRTEQPFGQGKNALASTGWSAGTAFYIESTSINGGLVLSGTYGAYNAEAQIGRTSLHLLRVEIGAYTNFSMFDGEAILTGSFGKAFQYTPAMNNGFGGSVGAAYEAGKRYGVFGRYGYYNMGSNTVGLLEAGIQVRVF